MEVKIKHCYECPYAVNTYEDDYISKECSKIEFYPPTPYTGIRNNCPFGGVKDEAKNY